MCMHMCNMHMDVHMHMCIYAHDMTCTRTCTHVQACRARNMCNAPAGRGPEVLRRCRQLSPELAVERVARWRAELRADLRCAAHDAQPLRLDCRGRLLHRCMRREAHVAPGRALHQVRGRVDARSDADRLRAKRHGANYMVLTTWY